MKRPEAPATDPSGRRFAHDSEASEGKSRIGGFSLSQSPKSSIPATESLKLFPLFPVSPVI